MTETPVRKNGQEAALLAALIALAASAGLFWQFISRGNQSGRALIPPAQIEHASGFRYTWRVPANLRAAPWYRAEVRILEDGKPLAFRVEDPETVSDQGKGRFGVSPFSVGAAQRELVWFSASDNSNPVNNGRKYEFEMRRTAYGLAILSSVCLAFSILASVIAVPAGIWSRLMQGVAGPGDARLFLLRRVAIGLAVLGGAVLVQAWPGTRMLVPVYLPAARLIQSEDCYSCRLPRWVEEGTAREYAMLYEDGKPMKRSSSWAWQTGTGGGTFFCSLDRPVRVCCCSFAAPNWPRRLFL